MGSGADGPEDPASWVLKPQIAEAGMKARRWRQEAFGGVLLDLLGSDIYVDLRVIRSIAS